MVSVLVAVPAVAGPGVAPPPLPAGRLAFATAGWEATATQTTMRVKGIGVVGLDGRNRLDLTAPPSPSHDHLPAWSPDGRFLAHMHALPVAAPDEIRVLRADGRGRSTTVGRGNWPEFSPDGRWLAWTTAAPDKPGVVLLPVDSSGEELRVDHAGARFLSLPTHSVAGSWSPDGTALAVWVRRTSDLSSLRDLFRLDVESGALLQLSRGVAQHIAGVRAAWHPLGSMLAFVAESPERQGAPGAYLVTADGAVQRALLPTTGPAYYSSVAWSPEGARLVLESNIYADGALVVTPAGEVVHRLGANVLTAVRSPVFSPDGTHVLAIADAVGGPYRPNLYALPLGAPAVARQLSRDQSVFPTTLTSVDPGLALRLFAATPAGTARAVADRLRLSPTTVVLAAPADEAVATPLAASLRAPLLVTSPAGLPAETEAALRAQVPRTAYVVGQLAPAAELQLRLLGVADVRSLTSPDPAIAAARVAQQLPSSTAYLSPTGDRTAQTAAAGVAGALRAPLLLTESSRLHAAARSALADAKASSVVVVGPVAPAVLDELRTAGLRVVHITAGQGRDLPVATAVHAHRAGLSLARPVVAAAADGSFGAALLAAATGSVLVVQSDDGVHVRRFVEQHRRTVQRVDVVGAPTAVSPGVETILERAAH